MGLQIAKIKAVKKMGFIVYIESTDSMIYTDSISRDERDAPLTQYITNAGITRARYTITHFKHHHHVQGLISKSNECITSKYSASLRTHRAK